MVLLPHSSKSVSSAFYGVRRHTEGSMRSFWRLPLLALPILTILGVPLRAETDATENFPLIEPATPDFSDVIPLPPARPKNLVLAPVSLSFREAVRAAILDRAAQTKNEGIAAFYVGRDGAPLFVTRDGISAKGRAVLARLALSGDDGLDTPVLSKLDPSGETDPDALAQVEIDMAQAAIAYARAARGGRLEPRKLGKLITPSLALPSAFNVLETLAVARDTDRALLSYNPPHEGYRALRAKLAELRETTGTIDTPTVTDGKKPAPAPISVADVLANMERWRWLPADLGERHIIVNVPEYRLRLIDQDRVTHESRVIVGKPNTQTPVFSDVMEHIIVNPSWSIPPSILRNEILPKLAQDPDYAAKLGYQVYRSGKSISVRQPPGERNALGLVKFMFPNEHAVYLHDTPNRSLFARDQRAFSHGCVRVDQPFRLAEFLLAAQGYDEPRLRGMVGSGERMVKLAKPVPVHLTYFTLKIGENGQIERVADIYNHDPGLKTALATQGRASYARLGQAR
jgi:murein L,D-transpeptidase YcbB/YkuD